MMRFGIPKYRLPREVLDAEMQRIVAMGVTLQLNTKVDDLAAMRTAASTPPSWPWARTSPSAPSSPPRTARILDAVQVLRSMEGEDKPLLGRRVVVYGGGNTAIDVARTAKRLGATEAIIVYRRTREKMPAHDFEVEEALQEGVMVKWLSTIKQAGDDGRRADDREDGARRTRATRSPPASSRRWRPTRWCWRWARTSTCRCWTACPAWSGRRRGAGRPGHDDDRPPRPLRRRRHGAGRAQRDGGRGPRQEGGAPHRRLAARRRGPRPSTRRRASSA
jgi:hypothetical protein